MHRRTALPILALSIAFGAATGHASEPSLAQRVERQLQPYLDIGHLSATVLIAQDGEPVYERSFGLANREHQVPNTPRTRFGVGSINKPMTLVILARLMEAGVLGPDDTLAKFLPDFPGGDEITVAHLARHQAGIPHRVTEPLDEVRPQTPASMAALAAQRDLVFPPGTDSVYSSAGFSVLARVLEVASGRPYADLLAAHLFEPAGMSDTTDAGSRAVVEGRAQAYSFDTHGFVNYPPADVSYLVGAGSVFSTPRDLLRMLGAILAGDLGATVRAQLMREDGSVSWNGSAVGYRAYLDHSAATGITVIVASNLTSGALDRIREALPRVAAGEELPVPAPIVARPAAVDLERLRSYEGAYELRPGRALTLRVVEGRVMMEEWLLIPTSQTTLFSPQDYAEIEVVFGDDGEVVRLDWTTGGNTYPMPRVAAAEDGGAERP